MILTGHRHHPVAAMAQTVAIIHHQTTAHTAVHGTVAPMHHSPLHHHQIVATKLLPQIAAALHQQIKQVQVHP